MNAKTRKALFFLCLWMAESLLIFNASAQTQPVAVTFSSNLTVGDTSAEVSSLQSILITDGYLHIGNPTGYFGSLTFAALANWQASVGLPPTGYFGSLSRAEIEEGARTITNMTTPSLSLNNNFGVSVSSNFFGLSNTTQNQEFKSMVSLGAGWIRFDMQWKIIQAQNSSTYNWFQTDSVVAAANANHLKILAILDYAPAWATTSSCSTTNDNCPPSGTASFVAFVKAAAQRYSAEGVSDWEIWNEPNDAQFWGPKSDCDAYTALLKVAYTTIKSVDPNAVVITGGLAPESTNGINISPTDFLSCIYRDGGRNYFDAVGDHPYTFPASPSNDGTGAWNQMSVTTPSLRSIMIANGDANKKIWITEYGTPTNGPDPQWYVSETQQSAIMTDAINAYKTYPWAGPLFWYTLEDNGTSTSTNENFFGLIRADGSTKPAYTTLQSLVSAGL